MMWDMMLYPGVPHASRRHRRGGRHGKKGRRCRACRERIGKVTVGGKAVEMAYCERHHCQKFLAGGAVCQEQRNGRNPLWKYCDLREFCRVLFSPPPCSFVPPLRDGEPRGGKSGGVSPC